jgi:hypothetical protein
MKDIIKKKKREKNPMSGYNPTARDFEGTEADIDEVNKSEKEFLEKTRKDSLNERTKEANTKPGKNKIN